MPRAFTPKVITANALLSGDAVWLTPEGRWSTELSQAELLTDEAQATAKLAAAEARASEVVGVYLAEARATANGPAPVHFREAFRARGPSNYPHGKQAEAS